MRARFRLIASLEAALDPPRQSGILGLVPKVPGSWSDTLVAGGICRGVKPLKAAKMSWCLVEDASGLPIGSGSADVEPPT